LAGEVAVTDNATNLTKDQEQHLRADFGAE